MCAITVGYATLITGSEGILTLGIVGGLGPESTIDYYRQIVQQYKARSGSDAAPAVLLNSLDVSRMLALVATGDLSALTDYLTRAVEALIRAGVDLVVIAASTPHLVFDEVQRRCPVELISAVDAACHRARTQGCTRLALFGTAFVMQASLYPATFAAAGITLIPPAPCDQEYIHTAYTRELLNGVVRPETFDQLASIVASLQRAHAVDGVLLAGTGLSALFRAPTVRGIPVVDATHAHVTRIVDRLIGPT